MSLKQEFIDAERSTKKYKFVLGHRLATALSGFIAGVVLTSIVWALAIFLHWLYIGP